jgi:cellulose biosynthesis protein BcsQ
MSAPSNPSAASSSSSASSSSATLIPSTTLLQQAAKLAIEQDRAILLDYYEQTANGTAFLGEDPETKERILVKSKEEFTSLIKKLYKVADDFIILTENSIYIVSGKIQKRKVNLASLQEAYDALQ